MESGENEVESGNCQTACEYLWDTDDDMLLACLDKTEDGEADVTATGGQPCNSLYTEHSRQGESSSLGADKKEIQVLTNTNVGTSSLGEPLRAYRPGYLWVSDFSSQHWCEQKLHYTFTLPVVMEKNPAMTEGSNLHLARELAAHDVVDVKVTSNEDIWAIKVLNLLTSVQGFLNGLSLAREVPVFGAPFDHDVFVVGLIDELRFNLDTYTIDLSDLKTRTARFMPSKSQQRPHDLQVMLYKKLFDDLVQGKVSKSIIQKHLKVKLDSEFGEGIQKHLDVHGIDCKTLDQLLDHTFRRLQSCTCVNRLSIEYVYQDTKETLLHKEVVYDEVELQSKYLYYLEYWHGRRDARGVDIEEAWKCQRCEFVDVCEWRKRKDEECSLKNQRNAYV